MKHLTPSEAFDYLQRTPEALFLDVRMEIEHLYVGHPRGAVHMAWYEYPDMQAQPARFVAQVEHEVGGDKTRPVVLLCRSGGRTINAGMALEQAGFTHVVNVLEGFEGDLDDQDQRGHLNGWRHAGLPWVQM